MGDCLWYTPITSPPPCPPNCLLRLLQWCHQAVSSQDHTPPSSSISVLAWVSYHPTDSPHSRQKSAFDSASHPLYPYMCGRQDIRGGALQQEIRLARLEPHVFDLRQPEPRALASRTWSMTVTGGCGTATSGHDLTTRRIPLTHRTPESPGLYT